MGRPIIFNESLTQDTFLTKEEEEKLPPCYVEEEIQLDYFTFLLENHLGTGNIAFERYYHFILDGNALHIRVHNEERNYKWRWDGRAKMTSTWYYKYILNRSSDDPFVLKIHAKIK